MEREREVAEPGTERGAGVTELVVARNGFFVAHSGLIASLISSPHQTSTSTSTGCPSTSTSSST